MKNATNSNNRGKVNKLLPIMQEHFGKSMNLARIKLMALLLEAMVRAQTVNLVRLANAMPNAARKHRGSTSRTRISLTWKGLSGYWLWCASPSSGYTSWVTTETKTSNRYAY